jgi:hypothetical protein
MRVLPLEFTLHLGVEGKRKTNFRPINPQKAKAKVYVLEKKEALKVVQITDKGLIHWRNKSRLEDGRVGCEVVWKEGEEKWKAVGYYLGRKKEVHNVEVCAIERGL